MARTHMRLHVSVWEDDDWLALTSAQQTVYLALCSSKDTSWCGVHPLLPQRLVGSSKDLTDRRVADALRVLAHRKFLVVDDRTAEILVRTFVRHDGILAQPNVAKAMVKAMDRVRSKRILTSIRTELARELEDNPDARGWAAVRSLNPDLFDALRSKASGNPLPIPFPKGA
ncbi:hypothetical protein [Phycicoccus sp. 3266]|uniref:hypothetical protein n=1 Tax=Phycicoccus sp. 3266 TaxID=2817751 RepID=UPI0028672F60|nr:hypothetical protein [Phycicoccus sp. 3266]MDR6861948.1 hypothetical protein [Phycicoccus sp. 3266]